MIAVCVCSWGAATSLADEIVGHVTSVKDKQVVIVLVGEFEPQSADTFEIVVEIETVGDASVADGKVDSITNGVVVGTITAATGEIENGQKVKINATKPVRSNKTPAAPEAATNSFPNGNLLASRQANPPNIPSKSEIIDPAGDCKISIAERKLVIAVPGTPTPHDLNPFWEYDNISGPRVVREVGDNFILQVKVQPFPIPAPKSFTGKNVKVSYVGAGLLVWVNDKTFVRCLRAARGEEGIVFVHLEAFLDGNSYRVAFEPGDARRLNKDQATYLRVQRTQDTLTFSTSIDGHQWSAIGTVADLKLPQRVRAGVGVVNATKLDYSSEFLDLSLTGK